MKSILIGDPTNNKTKIAVHVVSGAWVPHLHQIHQHSLCPEHLLTFPDRLFLEEFGRVQKKRVGNRGHVIWHLRCGMDPWAPPSAVRPAALWPSRRMQSLPRQAFAGSGTVSCSPTHLSRSRRPRRAHSTLTMCTPLFIFLLTLAKSARVALQFPKLHTKILANSDPFENTSNSQFGVNADEPWQRRFASNRPSSPSSNQRWAHQDTIHALAT